MSSAKLGEKEDSSLAVLMPQLAQDRVNLANRFHERVSTQERRRIEELNATQHSWSDDPCLHELFEAQARRTPHAPAVICGQVVLSYQELNARASRVAVSLLRAGLTAQEPVGLVADCSEHSIVGLLGILKAGGAYLPLDATLPEERLRYFLDDARTRIVVGYGNCPTWLRGVGVTYIDVSSLPSADDVRLPKVSPASLAYVLYTSGSTGKAKGVMLNHRGPVNTVRDINERFQVRACDRVLALSSLGFDLSVYDLFGMFAAGAAVVQPTLAQSRDPEQWCCLMEQHAVSIWNTVPALMDMLLTFSDSSVRYPRLRLVMLSGDWIPISLPNRVRTAASQAQIVSLGGSTEASIWSVLYPITHVDPEWRSIPYGVAMLNQRLYVVDDDLRLCPMGEVGELCLAGVGVAQGYMNRSELTAERFVVDPWDQDSLMYRTGDLCRYLPDGNLEFLGRRDHQVKIRGYRIGLGEIESEIARLPSVRESAVIASDEGTGARLIAYVVPHEGCSLSLDQLHAQLGSVLPEYMLPAALVCLQKLPLSPNGKVDRRQLPKPGVPRASGQLMRPQSPTESLVSEILCKLLKLPEIDVRDDFYALGGNSLLAVELVCHLRKTCGLRLSVPEVLARSLNTVELARLVDASTNTNSAHDAIPTLQPTGIRLERAPLSYSQQQMWMVNFLENKRQRYNVPLVYEIEPASSVDREGKVNNHASLDVSALQFALDQLVNRHDILRTVYVAKDSELEQVILPATQLEVQYTDLRSFPSQERFSQLDSLALEFLNRSFDLRQDLPIRASLYQISDHRWRLILSVHHIAIDGLSINLIQQEISTGYQTSLDGLARPVGQISAPLYQYADYASWQHEHMPPHVFSQEREYWREKLRDAWPVLNLPQDKVAASDIEGETLHLEITGPGFESLVKFAKEMQVTPFITLLATLKAMFYRYTGQDDIVIGSPISTRNDEVTQGIIGYFINVLPLRTRFDGHASFLQLLSHVRSTVLGAIEHHQYPLELLKKELLTSETAGTDPFRVMFVLEDEPSALELPGLVCTPRLIDNGTAKFDLLIAAFVRSGAIRIELQYRRSCFSRNRIESLGIHLQAMLDAVIQCPNEPLATLPWLPHTELSQIAGEATELSPSFLEVLSQQVTQNPTAVALQFGPNDMSYAELDQRSNVLAAHLQDQGVESGNRVGIALPRGFDMVVAVLAVLKCGAAYIPLDPAWPDKRRHQVLEDCSPSLVVTDSRMSRLSDASGEQVVRLNIDTLDWGRPGSTSYKPVVAKPQDIAYILYTSGSTGRPKGVSMPHAALDNLVAWQQRNSVAGPSTKTLQFASLGFDVSFQEIFATLCTGGRLVLIEESMQQDLNQLWKFVIASRIERLFVPFVALRGLCEIAGNTAGSASLKEVITAGEQLQITPAVRGFFAQLPDCMLWNQYGPTETHVVTAYQLPGGPLEWPASPVIGRPIDNCSVVLLDENRQPVPRGMVGELYLGGVCLARGYYGNTLLSQERFIDQRGTEDCRLYRTGDLGYLNWEGQLQYLGRNDHQVKVRGHRVELNEIELALAEFPGVQQAVVTLYTSGAGSQLRAHLLTTQPNLDLKEITRHLSTSLPSYMVPQQLIVVDHFPTTATGKLDRQRLATAESCHGQPAVKAPHQVAEDHVVSKLKAIWQSVLACDQIDAHANFFDCGGDSLAAAILFSRMEAEFGRVISIDTLIKCPTIHELAKVYRAEQCAVQDRWHKLTALQPLGTQRPIICLPGIDGHFLNFRHLAGLLGEDRPVFGLQPTGLDGVAAPLTDLAAIAAAHVESLRAAIPDGPYNLVGFSFGGIVAYEMAQILRLQGEQVALALIDCSTGVPLKPSLLQSMMFHVRYASRLPMQQRLRYLLERVYGYWLGIKFRLGLIDWEQRLSGLIDVKGTYARVAATNMQALADYRPAKAQGPAVLYRAALRANWPGRDRTDPAEPWSQLFAPGDFQVIDIDGAHASILNRPNVDKLVAHLQTLLH